jgi:hypothetical protein
MCAAECAVKGVLPESFQKRGRTKNSVRYQELCVRVVQGVKHLFKYTKDNFEDCCALYLKSPPKAHILQNWFLGWQH